MGTPEDSKTTRGRPRSQSLRSLVNSRTTDAGQATEARGRPMTTPTTKPRATDYGCPRCHLDTVLADATDRWGICATCGWHGMNQPDDDEPDRLDAPMVGDWSCPKCFFVQSFRTLNAHSGAVGVVPIADDPRCPNDGEPLQGRTWREFAKDLMAMIGQADASVATERSSRERAERRIDEMQVGGVDWPTSRFLFRQMLAVLGIDGEEPVSAALAKLNRHAKCSASSPQPIQSSPSPTPAELAAEDAKWDAVTARHADKLDAVTESLESIAATGGVIDLMEALKESLRRPLVPTTEPDNV